MLSTLNFESLPEVDYGSVVVAFNQALRAAYLDIKDRPNLMAARDVALTVKLKPMKDGEFVDVAFAVTTKQPGKATSRPMKIGREGLTFQADAQDNPDQLTIQDEE